MLPARLFSMLLYSFSDVSNTFSSYTDPFISYTSTLSSLVINVFTPEGLISSVIGFPMGPWIQLAPSSKAIPKLRLVLSLPPTLD